jgi:hypothetical protein
MKIRVIAGGIFGQDGEIPVGTEFSIKGEVPESWAKKVEVIGKDKADDAEAVTNPKKADK